MGRPDERDTVFYRSHLQPGTEEYELYYLHHPELILHDANMRSDVKPEFDVNSITAKAAAAHFSLLRHLRAGVHGNHAEEKLKIDPVSSMKELQSIAYIYGAVSVGACEAKDSYYYECRARGSLEGEIPDSLPHALVYAVEMDAALAHAAPAPPQQIAVATGYVRVAIIGLVVASFIRSLGYQADPHMSGENSIVMPPLAEDAGLGKVGRAGILVSEEFGTRIRLGAVTTDMYLHKSLNPSSNDFPLRDYCATCGICADACPGNAIPTDDGVSEAGTKRWIIDEVACFQTWRRFGTSCGVCQSVCPYSRGSA